MLRSVRSPWLLPLLSTVTFGCATAPARPPATPPGAPEALREAEFSGRPYSLRQSGALWPTPGGGASGRIQGQVCGADVGLQVARQASSLVLEGHVARQEAEIWVGEEPGARLISGSLGEQSFDLRLARHRLSGRIGTLLFDFRPSQKVRLGGGPDGPTLDLGDSSGLWRMPAPVQATLVPLMLACAIAQEPQGVASALLSDDE